MEKNLIKVGIKVTDSWYSELGVGTITNVLKTRFKIDFNQSGNLITYDFPHAQFLNIVEDDSKIL